MERLPEFDRFVKAHDELCFVLSLDFWSDEQFLPLKDAVVQAIISLDAVLIIGSTFYKLKCRTLCYILLTGLQKVGIIAVTGDDRL